MQSACLKKQIMQILRQLSEFLFSGVPVLAILAFSGIVLLPVLLPVAGTDHALEDSTGRVPRNVTDFERLALGNVQVSNPLI